MDKKEVVLLDVTVPRDDLEAEATATVALWENGVQTSKISSIPVKYLQPIHPEDQLGVTVVIFTGALAGKRGVTRSVDDDTVVVQLLEDQVLEDISRENMTLCVADHFG